uniref:Uncharacterized protein n=2 Tax=Chrysotila carterae TaxID=13221 RepID=A0A7S4B5J6_CHRCT
MAEAGQPKERLQRDFVAQQLNLPALRCNAMERVGTDMPLLHGLFAREARQQQQRLRQSEACGPQQRAPCTAATTMPRPAISASCEVFESVARPSAGTMAQAPLPFRETGGQRIYSDQAGHAGSSAQLSSGISSAPLSIDSCGDAQSDKSHVPASSQQMASKDKEELRFSCEHQRPMPTPIIFTG